ncbi:hypothetical protein [Vibrio cortegadensis]|uniref:hypothetical protein n=1 Tax=Vibrio cortegadensis TaxID=1328770 RepID=UPI0021C375D5|nr:hypothetical protein [Vibrio cortegadensis]
MKFFYPKPSKNINAVKMKSFSVNPMPLHARKDEKTKAEQAHARELKTEQRLEQQMLGMKMQAAGQMGIEQNRQKAPCHSKAAF